MTTPREAGVLANIGGLPIWKVAAMLLGLGAISIGQPLLDLLGQNPEFFIAQSLEPTGIVALMVAILLIPLVLVLIVWLAKLISPSLAGLVFLVAVGLLVASLAANALGRLPVAGVWVVVLALVIAIFVVAAFMTWEWVRSIFLYFLPAPLIVAAFFLFVSPTSDVLFGEESGNGATVSEVENPVPVFVLLFDEFPVASIIDPAGELRSDRYPNLDRLATDGVWYRNAVGVRQQTEEAIPTILSGVAAGEGSIPIAADHPQTLFAMLADTYDVDAVETVTELCPRDVCEGSTRRIRPLGRRWTRLGSDVLVLFAHIVTPDDLDDTLPRIDGMWGDFGVAEADSETTGGEFNIIERFLEGVEDDRREEMPRFLETLDDAGETSRPVLRVGHFLLPHHPWMYLPDGRAHGSGGSPGAEGTGWGPDVWLNEQGRQRHLLQVAYTDRALGDFIDGITDRGLYEDALIVVVADHGITIEENIPHQRIIYPETVGSIAAVPLFVKYPSDWSDAPQPGNIDDVRAETTDIVPTIAEVLGVEVPWETDGVSLLDSARSDRTESTMTGTGGPITFGVDGEEKVQVAEAMSQWFPTGDPYELLPDETLADLVGTTPDITETEGVQVTLDQAEVLADLDPDAEPLPSFLSGSVQADGGVPDDALVAILVDGEVTTVTRVYNAEGDSARFHAFIRPHLLHLGSNDVQAVMVGTLREVSSASS